MVVHQLTYPFRILEKTAFTFFLLVLVLSVLLFGAVHTYAYTFAFIGTLIGAIFLIKTNLKKDPENKTLQYPFINSPLNPLIFTFWIYLLFQFIPLPESILKIISAEAWIAGRMSLTASSIATSNHAPQPWLGLAPYFYPVRQSLVRWVVYWLLFWGLRQTLNSSKRINLAINLILVLGCFEVLYGLAQTYTGSEQIWWFKKQYYRDDVTGTYINHNHFAGFMEMVLLLAAAYVAALSHRRKKPDVGFNIRDSKKVIKILSREQLYSKRFLVLFAGAIIGMGLIFSASRGGMISAAGAMLLMGLLFLSKKWHRKKGAVLLVLFLLVSTYAVKIGVQYPLDRFKTFYTSYESRKRYAHRALEMAADYKFTGVGIGNFQYAYPKYQAAQDRNVGIQYAHNDWSQFGAEAGILGFIALLSCSFYLVFRTMKLWRRRNDPYAVCLGIAPIAAMAAIAIHSYSDFNLHIPANFMMLTAVLAIGHCALHLERGFNAERMLFHYHLFSFNLKGGLFFLAFVGMILWSGIWTVRHFVAEVYCNTVPNSTMKRDPHPSLDEIRKAIWWDGHNAEYRYKLARELIRIRNAEFGNWNLELGNNQKQKQRQIDIIRALEAAVRLNPFNSEYHLRLGWEYTYLWQEPDYRKKWLPAADISMERAAYFAGESRPDLHEQLGNFWVMRSKTMNPANPGWEPGWIKACWHYQKGLSLATGKERSKMNTRIKKYVWNYYPDKWFVDQAVGTAN
ncbi:MAG: O-antigen ligase family protein [Promethearchaeota archaeon]